MKKQAWTAILLWMALFSFTLSAQEGGGTTGLTVKIGDQSTETPISESYKIESSGTYHFKGTYNGTLTAEEGSSEGKAVISVETSEEVTIILENVTISLDEEKQCPLSARNATGKVTVQLKGTNTLTSGAQCPALWAPETSGGELIIKTFSEQESEVGSLTATAEGAQDAPGIGSMSREGSQITINSGTIKAIGGANAAGIGGGKDGNGGEITIEGGNVTAKGGNWGAGIGGGYGGGDDNGNEGNGGKITIKGGTVTANGGSSGAGIGGGFYGAGGTITIEGEDTNVTATGGNNGAGIGGGYLRDGGKIILSGGEVKATGSYGGAGIGGGYKGDGGEITISGGKVTATGGSPKDNSNNNDGGAGIGGGYQGAGGTITIKGGTVTATGGYDTAAGIGCGDSGTGGTITITGGKVTAIDGSNNGSTSGSIFDIKGNTVIVGPNATMEGPLNCNYTNGFVLSNTEASATMKGNATLLADMTIGNGQTLIIPTDASLTIEEKVTLTNNGAITNNGTIYNRGAIGGTSGCPDNGTIINQTKLIESMITITPDTYIYDGNAATPSVAVSPYTMTTDYTVEYENNKDAGTATVKVTPTDKDHGTLYGEAVTKEFTINKATPSAEHFKFTASSELTYDGQAKTATVVAEERFTGMGEITINYYKETQLLSSAPADAGTYTVKISVTEGTNFTAGSDITVDGWTFTIAKAAPIATDFTFTQPTDLTYNGQAKEANVQANSDITGMGNITINYYKETQLLSSAPADAGTYTVKISVTEGTNFTAGSDITADNWKFEITKAMPTFAAWTVSGKVYDGTPISGVTKPALTGIGNETISADKVTLTYYLSEGTTKTTAENSGAESEGAAPVWAGNYQVKASYAGNDNFKPAETSATFSITPANATLSFAQPTLTMTQGNAVPDNELTKPEDCTVTYTSSEPTVATVVAETGVVTVVGVGTTTITATAEGNYTGEASYTLTVNSNIPPYIPPTPDPDPVYYTVTIPTEVAGAIIHGGGTHEVEEYTYCSFRIELDPNGNGEYPTVTKGYWWDTLTPDGQGNYSVYVTGNTQITIGEVPTNSYDYYQVTLPTDSVAEADDQYWSGDYIEVTGASPLRAAEEASLSYQVPFGTTVTLRPIETERRKFLQWEDGSKQKERTLTLRADQAIKALWQRISPTGIEAIAAGSVIRGERGQLYIEVPEPCDVTLYTYGGVPVRVARLAAGANRLSNLNAGLYLVKLGAAPAVPVRVR